MRTPQESAAAWKAACHASRFNYAAGMGARGAVQAFVGAAQWIAEYLDDLDALPECEEPEVA